MKVRAVVVWLRHSVPVEWDGIRPTAYRSKLEFDVATWPTRTDRTGCLEFVTTTKGEVLLVPLEAIAWVELGPETERAG